MTALWNKVTRADVLRAIALFEAQNPLYPKPKNTFLLYGGKKYPAKHLRGMAFKLANGHTIAKAAYSGGAETVRFFEKLGFTMQYPNVHSQQKATKRVVKGHSAPQTLPPGVRRHKIARLVTTSKHYDTNGVPKYKALKALLEAFLDEVEGTRHFEFVLTPGGFLRFVFPASLPSNHTRDELEAAPLSPFFKEAAFVVDDFFKSLGKATYARLQSAADFFTLGIDGKKPFSPLHIELVAVYELRKEKVVQWTGKFYPTEEQKKDLVKVLDHTTRFTRLKGQKVVLLGCHDLNVYNPRGQASAGAGSWKRRTAKDFKGRCWKFAPDMVLQHPHNTDTPNIWNLAWRTMEKELPGVKHFASGIKYHYNGGAPRGTLEKVLAKTKKGDVHDFFFG